MVYHKKIIRSLFILVLIAGIFAQADKTDTQSNKDHAQVAAKKGEEASEKEESFFAEPKKGKPTRLSQARKDAVAYLEDIAHNLAVQIKEEADLLDDVMNLIRSTIEGDVSDPFVSTLKDDGGTLLARLKVFNDRLGTHHNELTQIGSFVTKNFAQKGGK